MFWAVSFPRKWSIRYVCSSLNASLTTRLSSRAEARSLPKGFSMITRAQLPSPDQFEPILKHPKAAGMNKACEGSRERVIIEKPFGSDLASARELNRVVSDAFSEEQTYRIDHFLGKGNRPEHFSAALR